MRPPKLLFMALVVGAGLATLLFRPGNAFAGVTVCRTDPIVTLSNGAQVTMVADVSDTQSDLQSVSFDLHVPYGLRVTNVQYDSTYVSLESFTFVADQSSNQYWESTTARTLTSGVSVTATGSISGVQCRSTAGSSTGTSGQAVIVSFGHCG